MSRRAAEKSSNRFLPEDAPDPNLGTRHTRRRFRERVAGLTLRGKLNYKIAMAALRAADGETQEEPRQIPHETAIHVMVNVVGGSPREVVVLPSPADELRLPPKPDDLASEHLKP